VVSFQARSQNCEKRLLTSPCPSVRSHWGSVGFPKEQYPIPIHWPNYSPYRGNQLSTRTKCNRSIVTTEHQGVGSLATRGEVIGEDGSIYESPEEKSRQTTPLCWPVIYIYVAEKL